MPLFGSPWASRREHLALAGGEPGRSAGTSAARAVPGGGEHGVGGHGIEPSGGDLRLQLDVRRLPRSAAPGTGRGCVIALYASAAASTGRWTESIVPPTPRW